MCTLGVLPDEPWDPSALSSPMPEMDVSSTVRISFLGGEEISWNLGPVERISVADVKRKVMALKGKPRGYSFLLLASNRQLTDDEILQPDEIPPLTAIYSASELSYRTMSADKSEVWLVGPYDPFYSEVYARMRANVAPESWVPAPRDHPTCSNLAKMSLGATVRVLPSETGVHRSAWIASSSKHPEIPARTASILTWAGPRWLSAWASCLRRGVLSAT